MKQMLVFGGLFGTGVLLVLTSQPHGASRPSLARRLAALRPDQTARSDRASERVFRTRLFEENLRPALERAGEWVMRVLALAGADLRTMARRLRTAGEHGGLPLFLGQKVAGSLIGLAFLPVAEAFGLAPRTPVWAWVVGALGGFAIPDAMLRSRAEARGRRMRQELVHLVELLSLSVSSGLGVEGAMEQATSAGDGPLFDELRRLAREARLRGEPSSQALVNLPEAVGMPTAESLATAVRSAATHGTSITQALRAQAAALRQQRRLELVESGERAQIRMLLPTGLLILPAFFVVVLYPAAMQLMKVTGP